MIGAAADVANTDADAEDVDAANADDDGDDSHDADDAGDNGGVSVCISVTKVIISKVGISPAKLSGTYSLTGRHLPFLHCQSKSGVSLYFLL